MTPATAKEFYNHEYRPLYGEGETFLEALHQEWLAQGRGVHRFVRSVLPRSPGRVLEIGCNTGASLVPFHAEGSEVFGYDFNADHVAYGQRVTGITSLSVAPWESFLASGRMADLVVLKDVLEHFLDLKGEVEKIHQVLAPGGFLYVSVPGTFQSVEEVYGGNILQLLQNAHVYQFSLTSLSYVLACCGFELVVGDEKLQALYRRCDWKRSVTQKPVGEADKVLNYLKAVESRYYPRWVVGQCLEKLGVKQWVNRWRNR